MAKHISSTIKITRPDLNRIIAVLHITVPIYAAVKHGRKITITTRFGEQSYTIPAPKKSRSKKATT